MYCHKAQHATKSIEFSYITTGYHFNMPYLHTNCACQVLLLMWLKEFTLAQSMEKVMQIYCDALPRQLFIVKYYGKASVKSFTHEAATVMCCQDKRKLHECETGFGQWDLISCFGLYDTRDLVFLSGAVVYVFLMYTKGYLSKNQWKQMNLNSFFIPYCIIFSFYVTNFTWCHLLVIQL